MTVILKIEPSPLFPFIFEGKTYSSQEFEIEFTPGKTKPQAPPVNPPSPPQEELPESEEEQVTL